MIWILGWAPGRECTLARRSAGCVSCCVCVCVCVCMFLRAYVLLALCDAVRKALLVLDAHAHLAREEVSGLLAGTWNASVACVCIRAAFPCRTTGSRLRVDDAATAEVRRSCMPSLDRPMIRGPAGLCYSWMHRLTCWLCVHVCACASASATGAPGAGRGCRCRVAGGGLVPQSSGRLPRPHRG